MNRRGFSFIEMLVVMSVIGILANLAVPMIRGVKIRAEAAAVIADVNTIRASAFDFYAQSQRFPRSGRWGRVPRELGPSLPNNFAFRNGPTVYRWRSYNRRRVRRTGQLAAVMVRSGDPALMEKVREIYRGGSVIGNRRRMVLFIE